MAQPFAATMMRRFGLAGTARLGQRLGAACNAVTVAAGGRWRRWQLGLAQLLGAFRFSFTALDREIAAQTEGADLGEGQKEAAVQHASMLPDIVVSASIHPCMVGQAREGTSDESGDDEWV